MLRVFSFILILTGLFLILLVFGPVLKEEVNYTVNNVIKKTQSLSGSGEGVFKNPILPPNMDYSLVIPKLNTAAPIISGVNPADPEEYLKSLRKGVAHANGTPHPDQIGNFFLFAHSTDAFWNVGKYNAVFFLIGHLKNDDEIDIYYKGRLYKYYVYDKKIVDASDIKYLGTLREGEKTLTLQTCYPPGTTIKRLVVLAKEDKNK